MINRDLDLCGVNNNYNVKRLLQNIINGTLLYYRNLETMSSLLLISILLSLLNLSKSQTVCIWGRQGSSTVINGEYNYVGANYYTKTIGWDCDWSQEVTTLYLSYQFNNQWQIQDGAASIQDYPLARCTSSTKASVKCDSNWSVFLGYPLMGSGWDNDADVYAVDGNCPEWNCNGINVTRSATSQCNGVYDRVGRNAYKKRGASQWIYFLDFEQYWVCHMALTPTQCINTVYKSSKGWEEFDPSDANLNKGQIGTIQCLPFPPTGDPTKVPSNNPSISPTYGQFSNS